MTPNDAINLAAALVGTKGRLCEQLQVSKQAINGWKTRGVPIKRALQIQELTGGVVKLGDLCPQYANIEIVQIENV
jgi:DNA-binding transcriptional regulator YdaS (Cro superfamily)